MNNETVPCKYCGQPTSMTGTKLCDGCWEVSHRVRTMAAETLARIIFSERGATGIEPKMLGGPQ